MSFYLDYLARCDEPSDMQHTMPILYDLAQWWEHPRIAELGVRTGNSTCAFLAALETQSRDYGIEGYLWSFDIEAPQVPEHWARCDRWVFTQADARDPVAASMLPAPLDVLFLDTDPHTFESTYRELEIWAPHVARGGLILAHDTDHPSGAEPAKAMQEYQRTAEARGQHLELRFRYGGHGLGIMRVR